MPKNVESVIIDSSVTEIGVRASKALTPISLERDGNSRTRGEFYSA